MSERFGKGYIERIGNLWILRLKGTPFERGLQHGILVREQAKVLLNFFESLPEILISRTLPDSRLKINALLRLKNILENEFQKNRESEVLEEINGLATGIGLDPSQIMRISLLPDLFQVAGSLARKYKRRIPVFPRFGCTSAIRQTPGGGLLFARNLDFWGAGYWDVNPAVIFHVPDKGKAFCAIATTGFPTASVTAVNEDGLALAIHQHGSLDSSFRSRPILDIVHLLIRNASSVDEAVRIAGEQKFSGGWTLVLAHGSPPKACALEVSSKIQKARWLSNNILVSTNHFLDPELKAREIMPNASAHLSSEARMARCQEILDLERITSSRMASLLNDHFDFLAGTERSAGFSISRITNISSVIFSLHDRKLWVSDSFSPTARGGYIFFDLDKEFEGRTYPSFRIENSELPAAQKTAAQNMYLRAYLEYIGSCNFEKILDVLIECSRIDPEESTYLLMEGIIRGKIGNYKAALASIRRSLELERVEAKRHVIKLWEARILSLSGRRKEAKIQFEEIAGFNDAPFRVREAARNGLRRGFHEKDINSILIDFTDGDTIE